MNIFKKFFNKSDASVKQPGENRFDLNRLIESKNINNSIIEIDNRISRLCAYGEDISKLNNIKKKFYYNQCLEREVNNGGFNQFYFNSSGNFAHETVDSLKAIGAHKTAEIVLRANNLFPDGRVPKDRNQRQEVLEQIEEKISDKFEKLEEEFFKYEDDLNFLNMAYIKNNIDKFNMNI